MAAPQRGRMARGSPAAWREGAWLSRGVGGGHVAAPRLAGRCVALLRRGGEGAWLSCGLARGHVAAPAAWREGAWLSPGRG